MDTPEKLCEIGRRAYARQLVAGTEGNLSFRVDRDRVCCTPSGVCKGLLQPADLCRVRLDGKQVEGHRPCSSEVPMHLGIYGANDRIGAVVHAHPPFATTFAVLGAADVAGVLPEGDLFFGEVPVVPFCMPGTAAMAEPLLPLLARFDAALLQNHGAVSWGPDLETAYTRMEMLEALCRVVYQARLLGGMQRIPPAERARLAEAREALRAAACAGPPAGA